MSNPEDSVYPLSDPRGIPLFFDVGEPLGLILTPVDVAASAEKVLPAGWEIVVLTCDVDALIMFGVGVALNLTEDVEKVYTQYVPAETTVCIKLPSLTYKTISYNGSSSGTLIIQHYRTWKAASQAVQQSQL